MLMLNNGKISGYGTPNQLLETNAIYQEVYHSQTQGSSYFSGLAAAIGHVACFYALGAVAAFAQNRMMAIITQGTLKNLRDEMFDHMQKLPIRCFDTHTHGDIMSMYTNDIDTLRQLISQSVPQMINSVITVISVLSPC